jgi:hypothetical protein
MKLTGRLSRLEQAARNKGTADACRLRTVRFEFWTRLGQALSPFPEIFKRVSGLLQESRSAQERGEPMSKEAFHEQLLAAVADHPEAQRAVVAEVERANTQVRECLSRPSVDHLQTSGASPLGRTGIFAPCGQISTSGDRLMKLRSRLERLQKCLPAAGCPSCRDRAGRIVLLTFRAGEDGTPVANGPTRAPAPCPRCGQVPERVLEVVETVVTTREEAQKLLAR